MSLRAFVGVAGVVLIALAATGLLWDLTVSEAALFGTSRSVDCGNSLRIEPMDGSSRIGGGHRERLMEPCQDAALIRRAIFWPIGGIGAIALAAAALIKPSSVRRPTT
ncbi:hypothetical protein ACWIGI_34680 [Nocardia sp. NPDC055321]